MPTTPFYLQQFRFLDGSLASGGKLYATVQGTETPAIIYLNPTLTTPAPQPLVLSADGIVPQFWAPTIPGLRFKLYDPRNGVDTLVWTRDYISDGDGVNAPGTVTSVGLTLGTAMDAIANVSSSPVVTSGNIGLELADQPSGKALMSPVSGTGKPSFRTVEFPRLQYAASDPKYLYPNVGDQYMVGTYGSTLVGAFAGHGGDIAEWTGSAWEFTTIPGNPMLVTKSNQVFYRRYGSWFLYWTYSDNYGTQFMDFSGTPLYCKEARDYSGSARWTLNEYGLEIRTGLTGTNFLSASINLSGHGNFSSVRTGTPSYPSVWTERINALGDGFLTSLSISGLTNGKIPRVTTAGGLLGDSCFGDDGTTASVSRQLVASRQVRSTFTTRGWNAGVSVQCPTPSISLVATDAPTDSKCADFVVEVDGTVNFRLINDASTSNSIWCSVTRVGMSITGIKFGAGLGLFGVTPPTSRPTISGQRTATATLAALYQAISATGLILDSTTGSSVTREAIIQPLPITNAAPGAVTVVSGGMKSFGFDGGASTEELFYHCDVQHDYIAGGNMVFHIHWMPATATGGNVKWQIEYQWVEGGATWPAPTTLTGTDAAGATAWADKRTDITIPGAGRTYNSRLMVRLFRVPTDAADTYAGDAVLSSVGMHYQADPGQP